MLVPPPPPRRRPCFPPPQGSLRLFLNAGPEAPRFFFFCGVRFFRLSPPLRLVWFRDRRPGPEVLPRGATSSRGRLSHKCSTWLVSEPALSSAAVLKTCHVVLFQGKTAILVSLLNVRADNVVRHDFPSAAERRRCGGRPLFGVRPLYAVMIV